MNVTASSPRTSTWAARSWSCVPERPLRVCALYPDLLNIYADRGNLLLLERRCAWRGIGFEVTGVTLGDGLDPDAHDLFYIGGGQDRAPRPLAGDTGGRKSHAVPAAPEIGRGSGRGK